MQKAYGDILECVGHGFWEWNPINNMVFFSPQWITMLGYAPENFQHHIDEWVGRIHPEDVSNCLNALAALLGGKVTHYKHQHRMRCANGTYKWVLDQAKVATFNNHGYPSKIVGTHTDIDDLRQAVEFYKHHCETTKASQRSV